MAVSVIALEPSRCLKRTLLRFVEVLPKKRSKGGALQHPADDKRVIQGSTVIESLATELSAEFVVPFTCLELSADRHERRRQLFDWILDGTQSRVQLVELIRIQKQRQQEVDDTLACPSAAVF